MKIDTVKESPVLEGVVDPNHESPRGNELTGRAPFNQKQLGSESKV
jgi:hypothetical protein